MKKVRVFAACALGQSISFLSEKMVEAAKKYDIELIIEQNTIDELHSINLDGYDVILVAPHVKWHAKRIRKQTNVPVEEIEGFIFAIMDGESAVKNYILPHVKDE